MRVETHVYEGYTIPPTYDSLVAKIIVWGADRAQALARARRALDECEIEGIATTLPFHRDVVRNAQFASGIVYTDFIPEHMPEYLC